MPDVQWLKKVAEELESGKRKMLTEADSFEFSCTACGKCCFGQDILLNPVDIYKIVNSNHAERMGIETTQDLFDLGLVHTFRGPSSRMPLCMITVKEDGGPCPFLVPAVEIHSEDVLKKVQEYARQGMNPAQAMDKAGLKINRFLCGLHEDGTKPTVCKSSPLGRLYQGDQIHYMVQPPHPACPGMKEKVTHNVGEWVRQMKLEDHYRHSPWFFDLTVDAFGLFTRMDPMSIHVLGQMLYNPDGIAMSYGVAPMEVPSKIFDVDEFMEFVKIKVESMLGMYCKFKVSNARDLLEAVRPSLKGLATEEMSPDDDE